MEPQLRRRRRPAQSCVECRRRKVKCDRQEPCAHCRASKNKCIYRVYSHEGIVWRQSAHETSEGSTSSQSAIAEQTGKDPPVLGTGNQPSMPLGGTAVGTITAGYSHASNISGHDGIQLPSTTQDAESETLVQCLFQRVLKLEEVLDSSPTSGLSQRGQSMLTSQSGLQDSQIILNKTRIMRWSHWMGTAREFAIIVDCYTEAIHIGTKASFQGNDTQALIVQMADFLHKCKNVAREIKATRPSRGLLAPGFADYTLPSRAVADAMVNIYFQSFESMHRILHEPTFRTEYQRYWSHSGNVANDLRLKISLVIGIGSSLHDYRTNDAEFCNRVYQWIFTAQTWLSGPLGKSRLSINGLQIHCLTILAQQVFSIDGDLMWISMGSLIHEAMQIGLHRDPKHLPAMSILQAQIRRRLWATICEMVVQSSLDSAMPPRLSFDEFDTEAPSNNNDDEIDESVTTLHPHPRNIYTSTSMQLLLLDSLPTRLRVVKLLNNLHSELSYPDVLSLTSQVIESYRASGSFLRENEKYGVTAFHRNLLDYLVRRFLLPLHCPFASSAKSNPLFHYSVRVSLDTAMTIISPEPDENFSRLLTLGGGMFREGFRYATTAISLELINHVEAQCLDKTLDRNPHYREILKQAIRKMMSLSVERFRQAETNIKCHMFLSMVLAQVEAMETGTSCEFKIAQGARDSLKTCHEVLCARIGNGIVLQDETDLLSTSLETVNEEYGWDLDMEFFFPEASFC